MSIRKSSIGADRPVRSSASSFGTVSEADPVRLTTESHFPGSPQDAMVFELVVQKVAVVSLKFRR